MLIVLFLAIVGSCLSDNDHASTSWSTLSPSASASSDSTSSPTENAPSAEGDIPEAALPYFPGDQDKSADELLDSTDQTPLVQAISQLATGEWDLRTKYSRDQFGQRWADVDHNGCDTRNDILARDLSNVQLKSGSCVVLSGQFTEPYTGTFITFQRGQNTSSKVQIDHVVALSNAWKTGAQSWDTTRRQLFANDPLNLLAVDGPANQNKSDQDAASWLPSNPGFQCQYVALQVAVKLKWQLWVTEAEKRTMAQVAALCPDQTLPQ